eukprot:TRINITY_DN3183_c0_g1_i1.p1 TRINITY_DN3183_c0_g1~~TRINITY_DN3183_c0_g1_i1.p1  ORF type:complete len:121 (-),score=3.98 TRINITY_DN3183_c0_g1_i1:97-459(-)
MHKYRAKSILFSLSPSLSLSLLTFRRRMYCFGALGSSTSFHCLTTCNCVLKVLINFIASIRALSTSKVPCACTKVGADWALITSESRGGAASEADVQVVASAGATGLVSSCTALLMSPWS